MACSSNQQINAESFRGTTGRYINEADLMMQILAKKIKIDPEEEERSKRILKDFLEIIINKMKETNELFKLLFQRVYYTGSFYDGLRISHATEFDINLVLKFPFPQNIRKLEYLSVKSFAKYRLLNNNWPEGKKEICEKVKKQFFEDNYLIANEVKKWMQSIIDKILRLGMPRIKNVLQVNVSSSGPAKTLKLRTAFGDCIDVDLVPVIEFISDEWPVGASKDVVKKFKVPKNDQFWFLVPKEYGGTQQLSSRDCERCWRIHFPEIEKDILHDKSHVKPIIKILKLMRDKERWDILASYYLKTVVMWMVKDNPDPAYWAADKAWERLIMTLEKLKEFVDKKHIPFLFYPECNLIEKMNSSQATIISNRLARIIRNVRDSYESIETYI